MFQRFLMKTLGRNGRDITLVLGAPGDDTETLRENVTACIGVVIVMLGVATPTIREWGSSLSHHRIIGDEVSLFLAVS